MNSVSPLNENPSKYYSNIQTNGDIFLGITRINGKAYREYVEASTRYKYIVNAYTDNLSFLRTAKDLHSLGIKNYRFMLKLYDKELLDVDPYSPMITAEEIKRVMIECKRNIWYFQRVVARLPVEGGAMGPGAGVRYQMNRGNLAATWCFVNNIDHYLVLPRQIGKTKSTINNILWAFLFSSGTKMMFLCKDGGGSKENLRTLKEQRDLLPLYMQSKVLLNDDGEKKKAQGDNATYLENQNNGNRISTATGGQSEDSADRCGRGLSQAIQFYDEVEFTKHIGTIIDAAGPAYNTASKNAKEQGAPYCRIFCSTPGNLDSEPVMSTNEFRAQMMRFDESFFDKSIDDAKETIFQNSAIRVVYIEFSYKQLGKDENWFLETCAKVSNNKIKIRREILLKRIRGSSISPFEAEDLEEISNNMKEPIEIIYIQQIWPLYVYEKLNRNIPYIVGVDVAAGGFGDNSAVTILDPYQCKPVADFKSNITTTPKLKKFLIDLVMKYIPHAIVVIENNNMGSSVIGDLKLSPIGQNLYFDNNKFFVPDSNEKLDAKGFAELEARNMRSFGINTNVKTRSMMINLLFEQVREHKKDFVTKFITEDLNALVRTPSGKVEAAKGSHDDSIMSYLIALYTWSFGSNLARYGFSRGDSAPEEEKPKTRQDYFNELPDDVKEYFAPAQAMQTSEEYDEEQKMLAELQRHQMMVTEGNGGISRNIDYDTDPDTGLNFEREDISWLDDLNK